MQDQAGHRRGGARYTQAPPTYHIFSVWLRCTLDQGYIYIERNQRLYHQDFRI